MVLFKISICMFPQTQYKFNIGINCKKKITWIFLKNKNNPRQLLCVQKLIEPHQL